MYSNSTLILRIILRRFTLIRKYESSDWVCEAFQDKIDDYEKLHISISLNPSFMTNT